MVIGVILNVWGVVMGYLVTTHYEWFDERLVTENDRRLAGQWCIVLSLLGLLVMVYDYAYDLGVIPC